MEEKLPKKREGTTTRGKLLLVAEKLFAEKGYHGAGVREITSKAGVNTSAISYYFGSKKNLF